MSAEDLEMEEVPPDFVPPPPSPPDVVSCKKCGRKWNMEDHEHRSQIVSLENGEVWHYYCCTCVPPEHTESTIKHLAGELYASSLLEKKLNADKKKLNAEIARLQQELSAAKTELVAANTASEQKLKKASLQVSNLRKQLNAELDENIKITAVLGKVRNQLQKITAEPRAFWPNLTGNPIAKKMQKSIFWKCSALYSRCRHTLRRLGVSRNKPIPPGLHENDSVHTILCEENCVIYCTTCRGVDDGNHLSDVHQPTLACVRLTGDLLKDRDALKVLALPFHLQTVARQTNGLAESE